MSGKVTFRIRRVPAGVSLDSLAGFLHRSIEGLGDLSNIHVRSLAAAPDDWREPPDQVATVDFDKVPSLFSVPGQDEWFVKLTNSNVRLVFDTHFLGFTPLSAPVEEEYAIEYVILPVLVTKADGDRVALQYLASLAILSAPGAGGTKQTHINSCGCVTSWPRISLL